MLHYLYNHRREAIEGRERAVFMHDVADTTDHITESALEVFYSYSGSKKDEELFLGLETYLHSLSQNESIKGWHHRSDTAGQHERQKMEEHLNSAPVILLLISPDYLKSPSCIDEMKRAIERSRAGEASVFPIILRPVTLEGLPFDTTQLLPTGGRPVTRWRSRDDAFQNIGNGLLMKLGLGISDSTASHEPEKPIVWNVPDFRNRYFVGRKDLMQRLHDKLTSNKHATLTQPLAISGLGGIGKTQTAIEYCYRHRNEYSYILWINATTSETLTTSFIELARLLKLPERKEKDQSLIVAAVKTWFRKNSDWLAIFDNADDLALVSDYLPSGGQGHLLLTSRSHDTDPLPSDPLEVEKMDNQEGVLLLLRRSEILSIDTPLELADPADLKAADAIMQLMDGLPLALDQAGAYIKKTGCDITGYLEVYHQQWPHLLKQRGGIGGKSPAYHPDPVATTWSLSFQKVEERDPMAADLLRCCAFLAPDAIPLQMLVDGASELGPLLLSITNYPWQLNEAIAILTDYSLVKLNKQGSDQAISIHRLVQTVQRENMDKTTRRGWIESVIRAIAKAFPTNEVANWNLCERYLPHAQMCANWIKDEQMEFFEAAMLLHKMARYLKEFAHYTEAEEFLRQTEDILTRLTELADSLSPEQLAEQAREKWEAIPAELMAKIKAIPEDLKQHIDAYPEEIRERIKEISAMNFASQQAFQASAFLPVIFQDQADICLIKGEYKAAEDLLKEGLSRSEKFFGQDNPLLTSLKKDLGEVYWKQGRFTLAESFLKEALKRREDEAGKDSSLIVHILVDLAHLDIELDRFTEAEEYLQRALAIRGNNPETDNLDRNALLYSLSLLYREQGKLKESEQLEQQTLRMAETLWGKDHPQIIGRSLNLALTHKYQGKYVEAGARYQQAIEDVEAKFGTEHPNLATIHANLGKLYLDQHLLTRAEEHFKKALEISEKTPGTEHPGLCIHYDHLGDLYRAQGKYKQAERYLKKALEFARRFPNPENLHVSSTLNQLGLVYHSQGQHSKAEAIYRKALSIDEKIRGSMHFNNVTVFVNLADVNSDLEKFDEAEIFLQRAIAVIEHAEMPGHPHMILCLNKLANLYHKRRKYDQAEQTLKQLLEITEKNSGFSHLDTAGYLDKLATLYTDQGKYEQAQPLKERVLDIGKRYLDNMTVEMERISAKYSVPGGPRSDLIALYVISAPRRKHKK
jgi:tetratricopeptide (TPR) repeat protein